MLLKLNIYFLLGIILILLLIYIDYIIFLEMSKIKNNVKPSKMVLFSGSTLSGLAQRPGFEPGVRFRTQPFQDCTIDHSDISAY